MPCCSLTMRNPHACRQGTKGDRIAERAGGATECCQPQRTSPCITYIERGSSSIPIDVRDIRYPSRRWSGPPSLKLRRDKGRSRMRTQPASEMPTTCSNFSLSRQHMSYTRCRTCVGQTRFGHGKRLTGAGLCPRRWYQLLLGDGLICCSEDIIDDLVEFLEPDRVVLLEFCIRSW